MSEQKEITRICPACGRVLEKDFLKCPYCGKNLSSNPEIKTARYLGIASLICALIGFFFFAVIFGFMAIAFGWGAVKGKDGLSKIMGVVGIIFGVLWVIIGLFAV